MDKDKFKKINKFLKKSSLFYKNYEDKALNHIEYILKEKKNSKKHYRFMIISRTFSIGPSIWWEDLKYPRQPVDFEFVLENSPPKLQERLLYHLDIFR